MFDIVRVPLQNDVAGAVSAEAAAGARSRRAVIKTVAQAVDEMKKVLHNLVSLLLTNTTIRSDAGESRKADRVL